MTNKSKQLALYVYLIPEIPLVLYYFMKSIKLSCLKLKSCSTVLHHSFHFELRSKLCIRSFRTTSQPSVGVLSHFMSCQFKIARNLQLCFSPLPLH